MARLGSRRRTTIAAATVGLAFAVLAVLVATGWAPLMELDRQVGAAAYDSVAGSPAAVDFWRFVAAAFEPWLVRTVLCVLALVLYLRGSRRTAAWVLVAVIASLVAVTLAKNAFSRQRPVFDPPLAEVSGYTFPSGHATGAGMAAALLSGLTVAIVANRGLRLLLVSLWWGFALLTAADRVFLGVHYLSDVTGGLLIGAFGTLAAATAFGEPRRGHRPEPEPSDAEPGRSRRLGIVLNPVGVEDAGGFKRRAEQATRSAGWEAPLWFETTIDEAGGSMAAEALIAGVDVVAVAGGDGTVRTVCAELAHTGVPVGIIPTGTGNLLARNLGLPLVPDAALEVVLHGTDRAVDIVRIEGDDLPTDHFVVMAGLGLDAAIMAGAPEAMKAKMGWPAYVFAALRLIRYPAMRMDISVDGAPAERFRARTVVVGNVGNLQAGIPLLPKAEIDDGRLDVVVIAPRRSLGWVALVWRVLLRRPSTDERLGRMTGQRVVVQAAHPAPRQIDGDLVSTGREIRAEVEAGVLLVRVAR